MRKIIYYVAVSLDGYISGRNGEIDSFIHQGEVVDKYLEDLKYFNVVLMGRKTYEAGYAYGLKPGQAPYSHMKHYIFSDTLTFKESAENVHVLECNEKVITDIKEDAPTDIYLCGGGTFAGWLAERKLIDEIKLKVNPIILGDGIKLLEKFSGNINLIETESISYSEGMRIVSYNCHY